MVAADTFCRSQTDILADELLAEGGKDSKYSRFADIYSLGHTQCTAVSAHRNPVVKSALKFALKK